MEKKALRSEYRRKRLELSAEDVAARSAALTERFFSLDATYQTVHVFLPIRKLNEVDTWPLIRALWQRSVQVATSVVAGAGVLAHHVITPATTFRENKFGGPEPQDALPIEETALDVVLVPLLAVDERGHRVGYGGGYYDRFLARCRPDCLTIGLSLFPPVPKITDAGLHDVRLDVGLTPNQTYWFTK